MKERTIGERQIYNKKHNQVIEASRVPRLGRLAAGLSPLRPEFAPKSVCVGFVVDREALRQGFLRVLRYSSCLSSFHRCYILTYHRPTTCAIALAKQHIIRPSVLSSELHF
jgi:hypothetical protein